MFILRHGTREDKPFLRSVVIGVTGLDISCSEEKKAMRFVSRGAAVQVGKALRGSFRFYGTKTSRNRYPILGLRSKKGNKSQ
ncbi:TPA: hypothetical protein ACLY9H_001669 [Streptococcus pneumoniae]